MTELSAEYLTTRELADLLRIKERKVYDLAASGDIPCTRALGKLLFRRSSIDAWLAKHGTSAGDTAKAAPCVFLGSHDPLLDWALRESNSGIATFFDGSTDGLERFSRGEGIAAALHIFDPENRDWNIAAVRQSISGKAAVLVEWGWRERGLIIGAGLKNSIRKIEDLAGHSVAPRQSGAGSQVLLERLLSEAKAEREAIRFSRAARTESDAALAVLEGQADAAFGLASVAKQYKLDFVPVIRERFDLLVSRPDWFEPPFQTFLEFCGSDTFAERASSMEGYDISGLGKVQLNCR